MLLSPPPPPFMNCGKYQGQSFSTFTSCVHVDPLFAVQFSLRHPSSFLCKMVKFVCQQRVLSIVSLEHQEGMVHIFILDVSAHYRLMWLASDLAALSSPAPAGARYRFLRLNDYAASGWITTTKKKTKKPEQWLFLFCRVKTHKIQRPTYMRHLVPKHCCCCARTHARSHVYTHTRGQVNK